MANYFLPPDVLDGLNLFDITFLNKEKQLLIRQTLGVPKDQRYLDKLTAFEYKDATGDRYKFHTEFQMVADAAFTERMADYMLLRSAKDRSDCFTLAIIGRAESSYRNEFILGRKGNGIAVWFDDFIIRGQSETLFQKPDCLISQLLYAAWLYEHQKMFSSGQLVEKFLIIIKNIGAFGFAGDEILCLILFVEKFTLECLPNRRVFTTFVNKVNTLLYNFDTMTSIEHIEERGYLRGEEQGMEQGMEQGRNQGREELANQVIKSLLLSGRDFTDDDIAKLVGTSVDRVAAVKAAK